MFKKTVLKEFLKKNKVDNTNAFVDEEPTEDIEKFVIENYATLHPVLKEIGGSSFNKGAFRIHTFGSSATWSNLLREYFSDLSFNFYCFGYDWMGCMYCYSLDEQSTVYIFDPADMDTREAETTIEDFFNIDLVKFRKQTLLLDKFESVKINLNIKSVDIDQCLGYKESLFLGGEDKDTNFDVWDLEVYWEMQYKIYFKIKDLPEGAEVGDINFEE